jgi:hypothetical protein
MKFVLPFLFSSIVFAAAPEERSLEKLLMRPEVVLGAVCAASLLAFSAGRLWDAPSPPPHLKDAVERRMENGIENAAASDPESEEAAEELGRALGPYLP